MSRYSSVAPLLNVVGGKPVPRKREIEIVEPDSPTAPPLSSESEESGDDEGAPKRGDIQSTNFATKDDKPIEPPAGARTTRTSTQPVRSSSSQSLKRSQESDPDEIEDPKKKPKLSVGKHHHVDPFAQKPKRKPTYGRGSQLAKPAAKPKQEERSSPSTSSPEKPNKLIVPEDPDNLLNTPQKEKKKNDLEIPADDGLFGSSPMKAEPKPNSTKGKAKGRVRPPRSRGKMNAPKEETPPPKPKFEIPSLDFDDMVFDSYLDEEPTPVTQLASYRSPSPDRGPVCPMCGESVEQDFLDDFSKKRYMTIAQQQRFCHAHKTKSARDIWSERGYPKINWSRLDKRIAKHYDFLRDILEGGSSHYGSIYSKGIQKGGNRTLLKMTGNLTPGYYGTRGLRVMTETLIDHFSALLRKVAVQDRVVSARGQTTFVQCVLVPELGVRLIMDDMHVDEQEARDIMKESVSVGELLNEEEEDVVLLEDESDGDSTSPLSSIGGDDDESDLM
jgi:hypothetical protein